MGSGCIAGVKYDSQPTRLEFLALIAGNSGRKAVISVNH